MAYIIGQQLRSKQGQVTNTVRGTECKRSDLVIFMPAPKSLGFKGNHLSPGRNRDVEVLSPFTELGLGEVSIFHVFSLLWSLHFLLPPVSCQVSP